MCGCFSESLLYIWNVAVWVVAGHLLKIWQWLKVLSTCGILISRGGHPLLMGPVVESRVLKFSTPTRPTMPALLWVGLIDLHPAISTFLSLASIGLSIHPSVCLSAWLPACLSVCLMCQYNVSTLSLSSEAGTDVLLLQPPPPSVILFCPEGCMRWFFNRRHKLWFYCRAQSCCCCPPISSFSPLQPAITSCFHLHSRIQGPST